MELIRVEGTLIAIGGDEDTTGDCRILREFIKRSGGEKAKIVLVTTATNTPEETAKGYSTLFNKLGAAEVKHVGVAERQDAADEKSLELIEKATGLFFTGGDQLHITSLMGGTPLQELILERYKKDLIVAGTSAGAAMMGNSMIVSGDSDENPRLGAVEIAPGTDLIVGCIIDTHFSQRGRHGRLLTAIAHYPQDIGFGIDENTAMIIEKGGFKVIGEGAVTVIDGGLMTYTDVPFNKRGDSLTLADVKLHVLGEDYKFDFKTRQVVIPGRKQHLAKSSTANENVSEKRVGEERNIL